MHPGFQPKNHPNQQKKQGVDDSVDDRETPSDVYDPLHAEFGFTLDVAAARHNAKCARYYARAPWTPLEAKQSTLFPRTFVGDPDALGYDGIAQPWGAAEVVWCNPPFSGLLSWVEKAHGAECTVVMLLPANRTEQPWWQRYVEPYRDDNANDPRWQAIIEQQFSGDRPRGKVKTRFLGGRKSFLHLDEVIGNSTSKNPPFGVVLVIWDRREVATGKRQRKAAASSRAPKAPKATADPVCLLHARGYVCPQCPGGLSTDGFGFVHPSKRAGRVAVRLCSWCLYPVDREHWDPDTSACTYPGCIEQRATGDT